MATEQIKVTSTSPYASTSTKSISYTNPDASNEQLAQLGKNFIALTDNTYGKTDRVITINCDTEGGGGKLTPTLTLTQSECSFSQLNNSNTGSFEIQLTTDSDGDIYIKYNGANGMAPISIAPTATQGTYYVGIYKVNLSGNDLTAKPQAITFGVMESDNYQAASVDFTITA